MACFLLCNMRRREGVTGTPCLRTAFMFPNAHTHEFKVLSRTRNSVRCNDCKAPWGGVKRGPYSRQSLLVMASQKGMSRRKAREGARALADLHLHPCVLRPQRGGGKGS